MVMVAFLSTSWGLYSISSSMGSHRIKYSPASMNPIKESQQLAEAPLIIHTRAEGEEGEEDKRS